MQMYLVQHGHAHPKKIDPERSLTAQGRRETRHVAALAARLDMGVVQIRHSGKTRAEQTASILGEALAPRDGLIAVGGLAPLDDVRAVADGLERESGPLMFVGHMPFMARLVGLLVADDPETTVVKFRNSAIVCLIRAEAHWQVDWILTPEMAAA